MKHPSQFIMGVLSSKFKCFDSSRKHAKTRKDSFEKVNLVNRLYDDIVINLR